MEWDPKKKEKGKQTEDKHSRVSSSFSQLFLQQAMKSIEVNLLFIVCPRP